MDKAKNAVNSLMSKAGHHDTTVHESVAPHVQKETINEHRREEQQIVRDREIHQDHHHTTIQPVQDREVLPEQHHHQMGAADHHTHDHRNHTETKERLQQEGAQFKNESVRAPTAHTTSTTAPEVVGEHVHHHVHEKIQPVVHKETIEPHVVHTIVPVHETHHNIAQHHTASTLPPVSMNEFQQQGGVLGGRGEHFEHFPGEPKSIEHAAAGARAHTGDHHGNNLNDASNTGMGTGLSNTHHNGNNASGLGTQGTTGSGLARENSAKPSLIDRINPMKDADGDGKKGFMK